MKKLTSIISAIAIVSAVTATVPFTANADDSLLYGTMNIPYADFYANEKIGYEVDAVSSATTSKWASNQEGGTVQGTFNEGNDDGTGRILGVTYPVAISQAALDALGSDNYSFTALDSVPEAYKEVTVSDDGTVSFSAVIDDEVENGKTSLTVETTSVWGNYCVTIDDLVYERGASASSIGKLYGCIVTDTDGNNYAMRHLENIWKNELGINVLEGSTDMHGSPSSYANFVGLNGATIDKITYITEKGYYIYDVDPDAYLAKKVTGTVSIADADISAGKTTVTSDLPTDYEAEYAVEGISGSISDNVLTYAEALPGSYSVAVSDKNGVYESFVVSFSLTSESMPATYAEGAIVKADEAEESDFANFIKNISSVSVNGKEYSASGRGSVKIISEEGKIDTEAVSRDTKVFEGSGSYQMIVKSTGYNHALAFDFEFGDTSEPTTEESSVPETTTTAKPNNTASTTTARNNTTNNTANNTVKNTSGTANTANTVSTNSESPKTGVSGIGVPAALMTAAMAAAFITRKKNR